jgi:hypothetical protein
LEHQIGNGDCFLADFMFHLTVEEKEEAAANCGHLAGIKFSKELPYVFTQNEAIIAANS